MGVGNSNLQIKATADESIELDAEEYVLDLLVLCNCLDTDTEKGAQAFVSRLSNTRATFPNVGVDFGASSNEAKERKRHESLHPRRGLQPEITTATE